MTKSPVFRAVVCLRRSIRASAIAALLAGCGGALSTPGDGGAPDGSSPATTDCPSDHDLDTQAAAGRACDGEGTFCANFACDPCNAACPAVRCVHGIWTPAVNTAVCLPQADASPIADARAADAAVCIAIDPTTYDQSCAHDPDCFAVTGGTFCSNAPLCMCQGATINVDGKSRYEAVLEDVRSRITPGPGGCSCPFFGTPRCVVGRCVLCGGPGGQMSCPDGG